MFYLKKLMQAIILGSMMSFSFATPQGITAFSITPLTAHTTVQSTGETSVQYTITNNATASIPNLSITPGWNSTGVNLSLSNDYCSGQTLVQGGSCTFNISIPGENQPNSFSIQPKVCGFNGMLCSQAANVFSVFVLSRSLPIRIYEVIFPFNSSSEQLIGINIDNTSDVIRASLTDPIQDGPLAISPDGSKVYMTHNNGDNTYGLLVFDVTANSLTQAETSYALSYNNNNLSSPGQIAIAPDGKTAYITDAGFSGIGYPLYKVDLSSSTSSTAVIGITDETTGHIAINPRSLVISPDGATVYFSNAYSDFSHIFSFSNSSSTTSVSTIALATDLTSIRQLLISSDGSTLYAAGQSNAATFPAVIEQYDIANDFSLEHTFSPDLDINGNTSSVALSPDNREIYAIVTQSGTYYLYAIHTSSMTAPSGGRLFPYNIVSFQLQNLPYTAYSSDGLTVSITNYGPLGNLTALFNPNTPDEVTTVNPTSDVLSMYSFTWGSFIN
jgi:6-phosphogluconolactonase (cycloisomerase 2 family)